MTDIVRGRMAGRLLASIGLDVAMTELYEAMDIPDMTEAPHPDRLPPPNPPPRARAFANCGVEGWLLFGPIFYDRRRVALCKIGIINSGPGYRLTGRSGKVAAELACGLRSPAGHSTTIGFMFVVGARKSWLPGAPGAVGP
jgi:hypothetical protein